MSDICSVPIIVATTRVAMKRCWRRTSRSLHIATPARTSSKRSSQAPGRLTFSDEFEVHLGGKVVKARYFGRSHTNGEAVICFPEFEDYAHPPGKRLVSVT